MAIFNFGLDATKTKVGDGDKVLLEKNPDKYNKFLFETVLTACSAAKYPTGLKGPFRRSFDRVLNSLDLAEGSQLDLPQTDIEFLKDIFGDDETPVAPQFVRIYYFYQKQLEECLKS